MKYLVLKYAIEPEVEVATRTLVRKHADKNGILLPGTLLT
jgi:hypothetical protein